MSLTRSERLAPLRAAQAEFLLDLLGLAERTSAGRAAAFKHPPEGTIEERWHVYAHGFVARVADALEGEYPAVRRVLGEGAFASLVARYLRACPPRSFDLAHAGDRLADFLVADPLATDLPFLPDLARLERRIAEAFVAEDAEPLSWNALQARAAEEVSETPLFLQPEACVVRSAWPLHAIWATRHAADDAVSVPLDAGDDRVLVFRRDLAVRCERVDADEARLVETAAAGPTTLSGLAASWGDEADLERFLHAFKRLVERGVFTEKKKRS